MAVSLLEAVVGLQDARREYLADGNVASRFVADREFIRGILDALLPAMDDTVSLLENKVRHELREAIMYDLYDNAKGVLGRIQDKEPEYKFSSAKGLY